MPLSILLNALARSFLAGELSVEGVRARAVRALGRPWIWLWPVAARFVAQFDNCPRPTQRAVVQFLLNDQDFGRARTQFGSQIAIADWVTEADLMQPSAAAARWGLPTIESVEELADWLGLALPELEWLADRQGLNAKSGRPALRHYVYRVMEKRSGGVRLVECPKQRLKEIQQRILADILDRVPPHAAAHGFVKGRSIRSFARVHAGRALVLRMDLEDFFPSFRAARVEALFRTLGYPEAVAQRLSGLATNAIPHGLKQLDAAARQLYGPRHLPQGAPTSPALANRMAYRLDCRLTGLARVAGADYTRYADDLVFSGDGEFRRAAGRFATQVAAIALEEGFRVNHRKTRRMSQGVRQQVAGVVVNQKPGLRRADLERLEATLTNCVRRGAATQNRESHPDFRAHLEGRIGFVSMITPAKGARLKAIFERIQW